MAEQVANYTKTSLVNNAKRLRRKIESPFFKSTSFLPCENENDGVNEVVMYQRNIQDTKPVHIGVTILQNSKLMMLKFVDFLKDHLEPDSYSLVYTGTIFE